MTGIGNWKFAMNEEYLVIASHQLAMITSLPFVHTARRSYQLGKEVRWKDGQRLRRLTKVSLIEVFLPY